MAYFASRAIRRPFGEKGQCIGHTSLCGSRAALTDTGRGYTVLHMAPRKIFSHLLLAVLAVGGLSCPCLGSTAMAHEAPSHPDHHGEAHSDAPGAEDDGWQQAQCKADCDRVSAESSRNDSIPCFSQPSFDSQFAVQELERLAWSSAPLAVSWTGPPSRSRPHETPFRRFDRLLV